MPKSPVSRKVAMSSGSKVASNTVASARSGKAAVSAPVRKGSAKVSQSVNDHSDDDDESEADASHAEDMVTLGAASDSDSDSGDDDATAAASTVPDDASDDSDANDDDDDNGDEEASDDGNDDEPIDMKALVSRAASRFTDLARAQASAATPTVVASKVLGFAPTSAAAAAEAAANPSAQFFTPSRTGAVQLASAGSLTKAAARTSSSYFFSSSALRSTVDDPVRALEAKIDSMHTSYGGITAVMSREELRAERKANRKDTAGKMWFDMAATKMTPEAERDLFILKNRQAVNPMGNYRRDATIGKSKYFQLGTMIEGNMEPHNRMSRRERKRTLFEEVAADASTVAVLKRRAQEITAANVRSNKGKGGYRKR